MNLLSYIAALLSPLRRAAHSTYKTSDVYMPLPPQDWVFSDRFVIPSLLLQDSVFTFIKPLVSVLALLENVLANRLAVSSISHRNKMGGGGQVNAKK